VIQIWKSKKTIPQEEKVLERDTNAIVRDQNGKQGTGHARPGKTDLMNLSLLLHHKKIEELTYYSSTTEVPMSDLVDFDYKEILNPPPKNSSLKTQKEINLVSFATLNRTKKDIDFVLKMDEDIDSFFIHFLKNNRLEYPERYINLFYDIVEPILMNCKNYWNRPRPNQLAKLYGTKIDVLVTDTIHTASYPSGHTVYSKLVANILSDIYPSLADKLDSIAKNTGIARVQQGVHYPSDNIASFKFSNFVYKKLQPKLRKYNETS